jgi:peptidoglycan hydrolase-like protein with peptidoglycan-binding domain
MVDVEPLYDLLRTNSVSQYLSRRTNNRYVSTLRQLLNELGFTRELQWSRLGADYNYGEETVLAVRAFAQKNRLSSNGIAVTPTMAIRMIQRYEMIEGISLLQQGLEQNSISSLFRPMDPNNYGTQQLVIMLQSLGFYESDIPEALRQYALSQNLFFEDGTRLTAPLGRALLADLLPSYGDEFRLQSQAPSPPDNTDEEIAQPEPPVITPVAPLPSKKLEVTEGSRKVAVSDGELQIEFIKRDLGVYTRGYQNVVNHIHTYHDKLINLDLTEASMAVVESVAKNEGNLDAINTYDRGFVSLGIFQWTMGSGPGAGELAALLKKIKTVYPHAFRVFFQSFGIDTSEDTNTTYGYLTYNGRRIAEPHLKDQFREPEWAFRFWRAAQNVDVQSIQVKHALDRLNNFYWKDSFRVNGYGLNEVITSSYGVALLLDNHVNRPAWVDNCVELAMTTTGLTDSPNNWTDAEEKRLIEAYLKIREDYTENGYAPMTKARERARGMYADLRQGLLSEQRGSFQVNELALRSYNAPRDPNMPQSYETSAAPKQCLPPPFYAQEDYPDIEMDLER